jgi:hypothetical protein
LTTDNDKFSTFIGKELKAAYGCLAQIKIMEDIMTCFFSFEPNSPDIAGSDCKGIHCSIETKS